MAKRSKLAVILHADVVGSTTLVQMDEGVAHERLQDVFRRLSQAIAVHGGITHELRGDAQVAEFARTSDAISVALTFQASNSAHNQALSDLIRPEVRIGIALGEVVQAERDRAQRTSLPAIDTWLLFQRGVAAYYATTATAMDEAVDLFDPVTRLDPRFAPALAMAAVARTRIAVNFRPEAHRVVEASARCEVGARRIVPPIGRVDLLDSTAGFISTRFQSWSVLQDIRPGARWRRGRVFARRGGQSP